jgi:peptide/nickel transport system permease protein
MDTVIRRLGAATLLAALVGALAAPWLAPDVGEQQFRDYLYAPPMRVRVVDADGHWHAPFVHRWRLADRVMRSFDEDRSERYPLRWFVDGRLVGLDSAAGQPLLLLGGDGLGRDLLSRLLLGARTTLGVAFLAAIGAVLIGVLVGGVAGYAGGIVDETLMRFADLVLVLPTIYAVLALRAVLPPVLSVGAVFWLLVGLLALVGWPYVARGVRAIVAAERGREYTLAAIAVGAGPIRILAIHLLPATRGFLTAQATLLLPAFILAEATLSYVGLGFAPPAASWGAMLSEASNISAIADFPWLLSPAAAIIAVVLAVNLASGAGARGGAFGALARSRRATPRGAA